MLKLIMTLLFFCFIALIGLIQAKPAKETGKLVPQHLKKEIKKKLSLSYWLFLPKDYDSKSKNKYPLILFLHGAGERGSDLEKVKVHGIPKIAQQDSAFPFICLAPQCPDNQWWTEHSDDLKGLIDETITHYKVDTNRIYLTGLSMGGFGTWDLAIKYPHLFAAIAPICGGGMPFLAERIKHLPAWVFHGAKDPVVPLSLSEDMVKILQHFQAPVQLTIYPEAGHDAWTETYNNPKLYTWFLSHSKDQP